MNPAVIAYVPPFKVPYAEAFLRNLAHFKAACPVVLFDDKEGNPEEWERENEHFRLTNHSFFVAIRKAVAGGFSHIIFLEADMRAGCQRWDEKILQQFEAWPGAVCGGTPVLWNFNRHSPELTKRSIRYAFNYQEATQMPMTFHGEHGKLVGNKVEGLVPYCLYPSGGVGVYEVDFLRRAFPDFQEEKPVLDTAWDMQVGFKLHEFYGDEITEKCAFLPCVFSGFMDEVLSHKERYEGLLSGRFCAVHQIKTDQDAI